MKRLGMFVFALLLAVTLGTGICLADINDDLFRAIEAKDVQKVKDLLSAGADANAKAKNILDEYITPLYIAAAKGNTEIVKMLLEKGADVNYSVGSFTALMAASGPGYTEIVGLLLKKGANVNAQDTTSGDTALMNAAMTGRTETAKLLIENGADINLTDKTGLTALHLAMTLSCHTETVRLLLMKGANVNAKTGNGSTPLMYAVTCPNEIVELLIKNGADVNAKSSRGTTALMIAAKEDQIGTAKLLIANGADVNAKSNNDRTALSVAEANDMIIFLRHAGAKGDKMPVQVPSALSAADIKFLTDECLIDRSDIDAIPKLEKKVKELLFTRIVRRDCTSLADFKAQRAYFKKLTHRKKGDDFPMPPAGWSADYMTDDEFKLYEKALDIW